mgnify:CR=1 FL=1
MAAIDPIYNGESGASVRDKLNELIDTVNSGSTTINVGDAPLFDPLKAGGYEAGSIISYKNESSPDPEFQEFKIYLALTDIPQGVSPEDSADWKNEGATVEVAGGNTANGVVQNIDRLRELTGMRTGHSVTVEEGGHVYVYNEGSEAGVKPFAPGIGSWELKYTKSVVEWQPGTYRSSPTLVLRNNAIYRLTRPVPFESTDFEAEASNPTPVWEKVSGGGGHTFEDQSGTALPTRSIAKAGAGIEFEDDAEGEKTVIRVEEDLTDHVDGADEVKHTGNQVGVFSESIAFVDGVMTFDKNKYIQSHQITATFEFTKSAGTHYSGAMIEACFVADGVTGHKPTFSADFNIQYDNWDNTNGAKNLIRMRYLPEGILTEIRKI